MAAAAPLMTRREAAEYLALAEKTLAQWAWRREGPPVYRIGGRARYRRDELDKWIATQRADTPTPA